MKKLVAAYNKLPSEQKLAKILKIVDAKKQKEETALVIQKKVEKKEIKKVKKTLKEEQKVIAEKSQAIRSYLKGDKRFTQIGDQVYLTGFESVPMPLMLVNTLLTMIALKENVDYLINFWKLCLLNPNPIARNKLFGYLSRHKLVITPNGYIVTYRNVKSTNNPDVFTSAHTGREEYRIGEVFRMDRAQCDEDGRNDCSRGLHTGTPAFLGIHGLDKIGDGYVDRGKVQIKTKEEGGGQGTGYGSSYTKKEIEVLRTQTFTTSFGNQAVICLVNPMHVVSVPDSDTRKLRSCELYFVKKTTPEEVVNIQTSEYHSYEHAYKAFEQKEIEEMLKKAKIEADFETAPPSSSSKNYARAQAAYEQKMRDLREKLNIGKDKISQDLSMEEINKIIQSRLGK